MLGLNVKKTRLYEPNTSSNTTLSSWPVPWVYVHSQFDFYLPLNAKALCVKLESSFLIQKKDNQFLLAYLACVCYQMKFFQQTVALLVNKSIIYDFRHSCHHRSTRFLHYREHIKDILNLSIIHSVDELWFPERQPLYARRIKVHAFEIKYN